MRRVTATAPGARGAPAPGAGAYALVAHALVLVLILAAAGARGDEYGYPVEHPDIATVFGTPPKLRAPVPESTGESTVRVTVRPERAVPSLFWYAEDLGFAFAPREGPAPLAFVIAGTGGNHLGPQMASLRGVLHGAGYHVISLPSPTHPEFLISASSTGVAGYMPQDARDLYAAMERAYAQIAPLIEVTDFHLLGYSLGATHAAFVSELDAERQGFDFRRVLLINPAVDTLASAERLDAYLRYLPGGIDNLPRYLERQFQRIARIYTEASTVQFDEEVLYAALRELGRELSREEQIAESRALIGLAFRAAAADLVFVADVMAQTNWIVPAGHPPGPTEPLLETLRVSFRQSFTDYVHGVLMPRLRALDRQETVAEIARASSLRSIAGHLAGSESVGVMTNADDIILSPEDVDFLRATFGERARIYPRGGHCGNLLYRETVEHMLRFLGGSP